MNYDGQINLTDFNRLAANFGKDIYDSDDEEGGGGEGAVGRSRGSEEYYTYDELWDMLMNWQP